MATDNATVSNNYVSNNPDIVVASRGTTPNNSQVQQVQLDFGTGTTRRPVTAADPLPVTMSGTSAVSAVTEAAVNVTTSSSTILAANSARIAGWLINLSDTTIFVSFSATATTSKIPVFQYGTLPLSCNGINYTGIVTAIHAGSGSKSVLIQWC